MKSILFTLILAVLASSTFALPLPPESFSAISENQRFSPETVGLEKAAGARSLFFVNRAAFEAAAPGLTREDFSGATVAPGATESCSSPLATGNPCFSSGGLSGALIVSASSGEIVTLGDHLFGNPTPAVAADLFSASMVFEFTRPDVHAVGLTFRLDRDADMAQIEIHGVDGAPLEVTTTAVRSVYSFWGVISSEPIGKITLTSINRRGEIVDSVLFGGADVPRPVESFEDGQIDPAWTLAGVGNANQTSVLVVDDGGNHELALTADGATAYLGKDNLGFLYREVYGDFRFESDLDTSTMTTGKSWRKAGLMVRVSNDDDAVRLLAMQAPLQGRLQFVAREVAGGPGNVKVALEEAAPYVVRLAIERVGQVLTVQYSLDDGATWITPSTGLGGSIEIPSLPPMLHVGLATVSNNISVTSTALFDDVLIAQD